MGIKMERGGEVDERRGARCQGLFSVFELSIDKAEEVYEGHET